MKALFATLFLIILLIVGSGAVSYYSTPSLLRGRVGSGGGYWGACPAENTADAEMQKAHPGLSPELQERLEKEFPPGTDEGRVIEVLTEQGFVKSIGCKNDPTIHDAIFRDKHFMGRETTALIAWKVGPGNKIVWIKGFVAYTFL